MTKSILWQAQDVMRAIQGRTLHEHSWEATGVSIDSRTIKHGDLFFALRGPVNDGHDHVNAALAAGAVAVIVARQPTYPCPSDAPLIYVEDTFIALHDLARASRARTKAKIIAVTGSVGKTSTKEMLRLSLQAVAKTYANPGSLNNHWGTPLSLANLPDDAVFGIFELGMNHAGELRDLSLLVKPDVAIVTTVEPAHLEFFASLDAVADAKAEIFAGMKKGGIAILNRSNSYFSRLAKAAKKVGIRKILSFAVEGKADAYMIDCALTSEGSAVNAKLLGYNIHYAIGAQGMHLAQNSLAVLLASATLSGKKDECAAPLLHYRSLQGRGEKSAVGVLGGVFTIIDESYNASPSSVRAAINVLSQLIPTQGGRRILVLGDMLELGSSSPSLHGELATFIEKSRIDSVYCCGEMMRYLYHSLPDALRGGYAGTSSELAPLVAEEIRANDIVSVKGSKGAHMENVIHALRHLETPNLARMAS